MAQLNNTIINGILRVNGGLSVSGNITASSFTGDLTGTATKALQDGNGAVISSTYAKLAGTQTFSGENTFSTANGFKYSGIETANGGAARPVWFNHSSITGIPVINSSQFTYNPATNTLKVGSVDGNATSATTATTATRLSASRNINGISFDGSQNIEIPYVAKIDARNSYHPQDVEPKYLTFAFSSFGGLDGTANNSQYVDVLGLSSWSNDSGGKVNALVASKIGTQGLYHYTGEFGASTWSGKKQVAYIDSNVESATYAKNARVTLTNPSEGTWYYPMWISGTAADTNFTVRVNNGLRHYSLEGTANAAGRTILQLGNATATGTAGNKYGEVRIYAEKAGFATLKATASATTESVHTFPTTGGTLLNTGTTSFTQTVTAGTKIGAIKINGTSQDILIPTSIETANKAKLLDNLYTSATRPTSANVPITGSGGLATFKATENMTTGKPTSDAHILHMYWDNTGGHDSQLAVINGNSPMIQLRGQSATTWGNWITVPRSTDNSTNNIVAMSTADYNSVKDSLPNGSLVAVW